MLGLSRSLVHCVWFSYRSNYSGLLHNVLKATKAHSHLVLAMCMAYASSSHRVFLYICVCWLFVVNIFHINCQMQYTQIFSSLSLSLALIHHDTFTAHLYTELRAKQTSHRIYSCLGICYCCSCFCDFFFFSLLIFVSHDSQTYSFFNEIDRKRKINCVGWDKMKLKPNQNEMYSWISILWWSPHHILDDFWWRILSMRIIFIAVYIILPNKYLLFISHVLFLHWIQLILLS